MRTQPERYERFRALHQQPGGFIMPNAWDGTSALLLAEAGFQTIGTSSAAIAAALGRLDGRHAVGRDEHLANARLLGDLTGLPINGDLEDGFGSAPADVVATVEAAKAASGRILLTGRTDNYLHGRPDLDDTIRRLVAFVEVGADVLFAPYPPDMAAVVAIVKAVSPKPVNVLVGPTSGPVRFAELQAAGVRRVSLGVALYTRAMGDLRTAAKQLASGDLASAAAGMGFGEIKTLIAAATSRAR